MTRCCLVAVMWCWSITRTTEPDEARLGRKILTENGGKYFHVLQIYRGCQHVLCDFINSWGTNSFDNCYEIFVWHRSHAVTAWQCDKWPDHHAPGHAAHQKYFSPKIFDFTTNFRDNNSILSVYTEFVITDLDAGHHEPDQSKLPLSGTWSNFNDSYQRVKE